MNEYPKLPEGTPRCLADPPCVRPAGHSGRCVGPVEDATNDGSIGTGRDYNIDELERQKRDGVGVFNPRFIAEDEIEQCQIAPKTT